MDQGDEQSLLAQAGLKERQTGVLIPDSQSMALSSSVLEALSKYAQGCPRKKARILLHGDETAHLHQMLIAAPKHTIWPPHFNDRSPQSWHVFQGALAFVRFEPPGDITEIQYLDAQDRTAAVFLRYPERAWYTTVPLRDDTIYLETKIGPQVKTRFADWGPQHEGCAESLKLIEKLKNRETN